MKILYVMYDARCGLCAQARDWLRSKAAYVDLRVLASDSGFAREKFPGLPAGELAVVSDAGEVWLGDNAFIMCLWALRDYRRWAIRLCSPVLRSLARQAFQAASENRHNLSSLLGLRSEAELERDLRGVTIPPCQTQ